MPRSSLGHYRILERVGSGGMGEVYSAEDLNLRRKVALKVLPRELSENPVARQRLVREARSASQLGHANIATIYEVGEDAGELYVAMELVEGQSLAQRIRSDPLSPEEIATIGAQVADALEAAHRQGVVHRDVKPGNILIRDDGAVKVVDFGLAIHTDAPPAPDDQTTSPTEEIRLTRSGFTAGTVAYMSPEQAKGAEATAAADIFALGIVLYEMATGMLPFQGATPLAVAAAIVHEQPAPPRELRPEIPAGLEKIILRCLNKTKEARPASAARIRDALRALSEKRSTQSIMMVLGSGRGWVRPALWAGIVLISALAIAVWYLRPPAPDEPPPITNVDARRHFEQAQSYEQRGYSPTTLESAEESYRKALDIEPDNPLIQAWLANVLARLEQQYPEEGRRDEIRALIDSALEAEPDLAVGWAVRGRLRLLEDDTAGAEQAGRKAIAADEGNPAGYIVVAQALIDRGEVDAGLAELRRGVALERGHIWARSVLARRLYDLGRLDEAAVEYGTILEYDPSHTTALTNLGAIYLGMGRFAESIDLHKRLLDLQPDDVAAGNLGTSYFYLGRMEEAIAAYQRAVELGPDFPVHKVNLGDAYEAVDEIASAREWYTKALQNYDKQLSHVAEGRKAEMLARRGYCAAKLGRFAEAEQNVEAALRQVPNSHELLYEAARVYAMAGKRELMVDHIRQAVEAGYPRGLILDDPTFQEYRDEPGFLDLLTGTGS